MTATARKTREDKERERLYLEESAWRTYVAKLSQISDLRAAQRFADHGPHGVEPGSRYYHNLGCYLHGNPLNRPRRQEWDEILKLVQRAEAVGNVPAGRSAALEAQINSERGRRSHDDE